MNELKLKRPAPFPAFGPRLLPAAPGEGARRFFLRETIAHLPCAEGVTTPSHWGGVRKFPFGGLESDPGQDPAVGLTGGSAGNTSGWRNAGSAFRVRNPLAGSPLLNRTALLGASAHPLSTGLLQVTQCGFFLR